MNLSLPDFSKLRTGYLILLFYSFIMSLGATIGYMVDNKNGFTRGYIVGMVISLALWFQVGKDIAKL